MYVRYPCFKSIYTTILVYIQRADIYIDIPVFFIGIVCQRLSCTELGSRVILSRLGSVHVHSSSFQVPMFQTHP